VEVHGIVHIVGGGLAGCEAAWQVARAGGRAVLYEMRPVRQTPAHKTDGLAELVCSNSLKSEQENGAPWQTKKIESVVSHFGSSEIYLKRYRQELIDHERVTLILGAVLLRLEMDQLSRTITSAQAGTPNGRKFLVRARVFVIAAGGLENARQPSFGPLSSNSSVV